MTYINLLLILAGIGTAWYSIQTACQILAYHVVSSGGGYVNAIGGVALYQGNKGMRTPRLSALAIQAVALAPLIGQMSFSVLATVVTTIVIMGWQSCSDALHESKATRWVHAIAAVMATGGNAYLAMQPY